jgi:hypothetical protein
VCASFFGVVLQEEGGQLTEAVRRSPHSVVLLDELEKAHGDVLNILLQIMEDGILTDGKGRTVNFKNTILVMTSNVGSTRILDVTRAHDESSFAETAVPSTRPVSSNGMVSSGAAPMEPMRPQEVLTKLQNNPAAMSLMMEAASDSDLMGAMQTAMGGSPADLLKAGRDNPKVASFLKKLWSVIDERPSSFAATQKTNGSTNNPSGLDAIRGSVEDAVSNWTNPAAETFASGLVEKMQDLTGTSLDPQAAYAPELQGGTADETLYAKLSQVVKDELEATMKPELLNRLDEIVVFSPLSSTDLTSIASLLLQQTVKRAQTERRMTLELGDSLIQKVRDEGSAQASTFGARPMRRAAQRFLEDAVSDAIVRGFLEEGDSATVDLAPRAVDGTCFVVQVTRKRDGERLDVNVENGSGGFGSGVPLVMKQRQSDNVNGETSLETETVRS